MSQEAALHEKAERLVRKLEDVRRSHAELPEEERRAAFEQALDEELGRVPAADADKVIEGVRTRLIQTARQRDQRVEQLEGMVREQEAKIEDLSKQLKEALDALAKPAPAPAPSPSPGPGPAPDLDVVRAALTRVVEGKAPDVAGLGLSPQDESLYLLFAGLMQFTTAFGESRTWILASLGVGAAGLGDTMIRKGMQDKAKQAMRDSLGGDASAAKTLQTELKVYAKFLIALNESFMSSIDVGTRTVLGELAHQELLERHKGRMVGYDYEAAWRELEGIHARLSDLTRGDLWEQYFREPLRKKLG